MLKATKSFESLLIPQLPRSPPDVEAMRIYLILSECPALHDSKNYIRLTIPLAMAILRLDANPSKVLGIICWAYFLFMSQKVRDVWPLGEIYETCKKAKD